MAALYSCKNIQRRDQISRETKCERGCEHKGDLHKRYFRFSKVGIFVHLSSINLLPGPLNRCSGLRLPLATVTAKV